MPSPIFTHQRCAVVAAFACLWAGVLSPLCAPGPLLPQAQAAAGAALDQGDGYGAKMLEKIVAVWAPPPALKGDFIVRLRVRVDAKGAVTDCVPLRSSGMEALDISACGAVRQGGGYGVPPYAQPLEVQLAFWTGTPKGKPRLTAPSSEEALRAEVRARTKAEAAISDARAAAAEDRAREKAEELARQTAGAAVAQPPAAAAQQPAPSVLPAAPFPAAAGRPVTPAAEPRQHAVPAVQADKTAGSAPDKAALQRYTRAVSRRLREHIVIPAETAPGEYRVPLRLEVDSQSGEIKDFTVLRDTGDKLLDRYIRLGIRRAGSVPPPPQGQGGRLEFTLVLLRP